MLFSVCGLCITSMLMVTMVSLAYSYAQVNAQGILQIVEDWDYLPWTNMYIATVCTGSDDNVFTKYHSGSAPGCYKYETRRNS